MGWGSVKCEKCEKCGHILSDSEIYQFIEKSKLNDELSEIKLFSKFLISEGYANENMNNLGVESFVKIIDIYKVIVRYYHNQNLSMTINLTLMPIKNMGLEDIWCLWDLKEFTLDKFKQKLSEIIK